VELTADADHVLRIGVLSAIKDDREPTLTAVRTLRERLEKAGVDVLVVNGDLATNLFELQKVFAALAESPVLVVASIGNTESCGAFNQAAEEVFATQRHVINGNWVRRLELDDGTLVTLPGYYDRRFTHTGGAAHYDAKDLEVLSDLLLSPAEAPAPVVLISHGPAARRGQEGHRRGERRQPRGRRCADRCHEGPPHDVRPVRPHPRVRRPRHRQPGQAAQGGGRLAREPDRERGLRQHRPVDDGRGHHLVRHGVARRAGVAAQAPRASALYRREAARTVGRDRAGASQPHRSPKRT
jgi:hypothetical protein